MGEPLGRELLDGGDVLEPGVGHHDVGNEVEAVEGVECAGLRKVRLHRPAPDLRGDTAGPLAVEVEHRDLCPRDGKALRACPADAARAPGDERPAAGEIDAGRSPAAGSHFPPHPRLLDADPRESP